MNPRYPRYLMSINTTNQKGSLIMITTFNVDSSILNTVVVVEDYLQGYVWV